MWVLTQWPSPDRPRHGSTPPPHTLYLFHPLCRTSQHPHYLSACLSIACPPSHSGCVLSVVPKPGPGPWDLIDKERAGRRGGGEGRGRDKGDREAGGRERGGAGDGRGGGEEALPPSWHQAAPH